MHFGIYISPWDRHETTYGDSPRYNEHFLDQLREVLTTIRGSKEVWFDGACGEGPNGKKQVYDWRAYWKLIREVAPMPPSASAGRMCDGAATKAGILAAGMERYPMPGDDQPWKVSDKTLSRFHPRYLRRQPWKPQRADCAAATTIRFSVMMYTPNYVTMRTAVNNATLKMFEGALKSADDVIMAARSRSTSRPSASRNDVTH